MKKGNPIWVLFLLFLATVFCGVISTLMSLFLTEAAGDIFHHPTPEFFSRFSAILHSIFIFGSCIGGYLMGSIADRFGRKNSTLLTLLILGLSTWFIAYTVDEYLLYSLRFLSGLGVGGLLVISFTYLNEIWNPQSVAIVAGILSVAFPIGIFSAGAMKYLVSHWQQAFLIGPIPIGIALIGFFIMEESQAWKSAMTRKTEAPRRISSDPEFRKNLLSGALIFGTMLIGLWAIFLWLPSWVESISPLTDIDRNTGTSMMLLGAGGLIGGFFSGWIMNFLGEKRSLQLCFLVCSGFSFLLFFTNRSVSTILFVEICLLAFFFGMSQGVLAAYIPQLFPAEIKGRATGFCFNAGRLLTALAVLFVGLLVQVFGGYGNTLLVFSSVFIIGLISVFLSKEHKRNKI